ncbi:MAG: Tetratricopeptide TPR2 [Candidatus Peregrinibacteria bacterium Greene0416_19]|nr:MAG: Tetratricopeptide TPR2 [Candidatus Peregrinibacteria bacterium Greene0416_19]
MVNWRRFLRIATENGVVLFLLVSILWRGGKTLDATWLLGGVACAVTVADMLYRRRGETARPAPALILLGFLAASVLSYLTSAARNYGLDELIRDTALLLLFLWTVRTERAERNDPLPFHERVLITIAIATVVACGVGIAVYVLQPVNRFVGTFFDFRFHTDYWPNAWAEYLLLAWPAVFWFLRRFPVPVRVPVFGIVIACFLLSYSRGAALAFSGQIVLLGILGIHQLLRIQRAQGVRTALQKGWSVLVRTLLIGCGAALIALVLFGAINLLRSRFHDVESVRAKVTFTAQEGRSSVDERQEFFAAAVQLIRERPLFGWGPYSFRFVQPRYQQSVFATSDHSHNAFLKIAMERGIPAMMLFTAFLFCVVVGAWRRIVEGAYSGKSADDPIFHSFQPLALVSIAGVFAHNLIDYNLQFVGIVLPLWLLMGLLIAGAPPAGQRWGGVGRWGGLVLSFLLMAVLLREGWFLAVSSLGRRAEARGDPESALVFYEQASAEWFPRDLHLSRAYLLIGLHRYPEALDALDRYAEDNVEDARLWKMRGDVLQQLGRTVEALRAYDEAFVRGKLNYVSIARSILESLLAADDAAAIVRRKPDFDAIVDAYADAILKNAHFIALSGNVEEYLAFLDLLGTTYPSAIVRYRELFSRVREHAERERARLSGRDRGYLW